LLAEVAGAKGDARAVQILGSCAERFSERATERTKALRTTTVETLQRRPAIVAAHQRKIYEMVAEAVKIIGK
jgi:hypothetical protein